MAKKCQISGKSNQFGHRVSHAKNKTKHTFHPNLQSKRIFVAEENRYVRISVFTRILRTIDKIGLAATLKKHNLKLNDLASGPRCSKEAFAKAGKQTKKAAPKAA